jgi:hypothetical protein
MPVNFTETAPPKKTAAKRTVPPSRTASPDAIRKDREDAVNGIFQIGSLIAMTFGQWADAGAINTHAPGITTETVKIADKYDSLGKGIDALAQVSPFAAIIGAVTPLVIQLAANHKMISAQQGAALGATNPEVLAQQMQIQANREAIRIQMQMAEEKRLMAEEMADLERQMGQRVDEVVTVPA